MSAARHMSAGVSSGWARMCRNSATLVAASVAAAGLVAGSAALPSDDARTALSLQQAQLVVAEYDLAWG
ncbi:hypothetical protein ACX6XY_05890 [Streptomyces sp. O3]